MALPRSDFALAKCLLDTNRIQQSQLRQIMEVGSLLEGCDMAAFWKLMKGQYTSEDAEFNVTEMIKTIKKVKGFEDSVRNC